LQTVLANDEIIIKDNKMYSERGEYPVIKKPLKQ
jgi:leucyl-tRNA synthetase